MQYDYNGAIMAGGGKWQVYESRRVHGSTVRVVVAFGLSERLAKEMAGDGRRAEQM